MERIAKYVAMHGTDGLSSGKEQVCMLASLFSLTFKLVLSLLTSSSPPPHPVPLSSSGD